MLATPSYSNPGQANTNWFGAVSLFDRWGRVLSGSLSYEAEYQNSNITFCAGPTCSRSILIHRITVGVHWQTGPLGF